ncbi:MAG: hypothetical protein ABH954_02650 [Candidatus Omnitrophota bacterium]
MKKIFITICGLIIMLSLTVLAHAYSRQEQCDCNDPNITLSGAIKGELGDVFAADGDFIDIPDSQSGAGVVSSSDITLTRPTPTTTPPQTEETEEYSLCASGNC